MFGKTGENHPMYGRTGENHPMFGKTGENHPMFGKTHSPETIAKISEAIKGIWISEETRALRSMPKSEETKAKISEANKGEKHPMFGKLIQKRLRQKWVLLKVLLSLFMILMVYLLINSLQLMLLQKIIIVII